MRSFCTVPDCTALPHGRGLCEKHYRRLSRTGSTGAQRERIADPLARFHDSYVAEDSGCWIWNRSIVGSGYGSFYVDGRQTSAHRFSYERTVGPIPPGLLVHHVCGERRCVNPVHLALISRHDHSTLHAQERRAELSHRS